MPNVNPGPASTATPSATNVLAPASTPNFGNLYQGSDAFRLLAFQQAVNISSRSDGWDHRRPKGRDWKNYCPSCAEQPNPAAELAGLYFGKKSSDD